MFRSKKSNFYLLNFVILISFLPFINCDVCTIRAICHCNVQKNVTDKVNYDLSSGSDLDICNANPPNKTTDSVAAQKLSLNIYELPKYQFLLNCTYLSIANSSSSFKPPAESIGNDTFTLSLHYQCDPPPQPSNGYSTGSILVIILFTCVFAYLGLGICVNFFLVGARGIEMIPNLDFWKDFPALVLDGVKFIQNGCTARPSDLTAPSGAEGYDAI